MVEEATIRAARQAPRVTRATPVVDRQRPAIDFRITRATRDRQGRALRNHIAAAIFASFWVGSALKTVKNRIAGCARPFLPENPRSCQNIRALTKAIGRTCRMGRAAFWRAKSRFRQKIAASGRQWTKKRLRGRARQAGANCVHAGAADAAPQLAESRVPDGSELRVGQH